MRPIKALVVATLAAAGMMATADVYADVKHGWRGGGSHAGRHWNGGHRHFGHGHRHWGGTHFGLSIGVPLFYGAYAWGGYPYAWGGYPYYDPWYYGPTVVYREREVIREPEVVETIREVPATTEVPRSEGAPRSGPLYMNYCESAKAYYPKVTQCPEGWKFISPTQ